MSSFSSLSVANSGLRAAQAGLYVMGHNISNLDTLGYVRQTVVQEDFFYHTRGNNANGKMQVGLGTNVQGIRQIRDNFLDLSYREENSKLGYYGSRYEIGSTIESIFGELHSDYTNSDVLKDVWTSINELVTYNSGLETRNNFVTTCYSFLNKMQNTYDRLLEEQRNLNNEVKSTVTNINNLLDTINDYSKKIIANEFSGDHANDFRDARNLALDELSGLIDMTYKEMPDGSITIHTEGKELLGGGVVTKLGLRFTTEGSSFVEPVIPARDEIYNCDETSPMSLYNFSGAKATAPGGKLKALLLSRGTVAANYTTGEDAAKTEEVFNVTNCTIPKVMKQLDKLFNTVAELINNAVAPKTDTPPAEKNKTDGPWDLNGEQTFEEIFVRNGTSRWNGDLYNEENPADPNSLYSITNVSINPLFWGEDAKLDQISLSKSQHGIDDTTVPKEILEAWKTDLVKEDGKNLSIDKFYEFIISDHGSKTNIDKTYTEQQASLVQKTDSDRQAIMGVSMDEEMQFMLIYQHAYNAGARVVNVLDSMIETVINL